MSLETSLAEPLWAAIEAAYESRNYTGAIQDAIYYLGDIIREKAGLQSDGVALVGQALGGKSPKLKVNKLQTESERNIQKGTENLLLGLYQSIRNPRSHGKHVDTKEDADAIVLFIDYLLKIIGGAKGTFSKSEFLDRVFDPSFVNRNRYAELLVGRIPLKQRLDVMIDVYRRKEEGEINKLKLFSHALVAKLDEDEISRLAEVVSEELSNTDSDKSVRFSTEMFPIEFWTRLDESAKLRTENRFLESVAEGEYITSAGKCIKGALGTWCGEHLDVFLMKNDFIRALLAKLDSSNTTEQDYVFKFFHWVLLSTLTAMPGTTLANSAIRIINRHVKAGDKRFYDFANTAIEYFEEFWKDSLKESVENFQEVEPTPVDTSEDLPFNS
jgi:uncharacterized protein (TIGR02391 family)